MDEKALFYPFPHGAIKNACSEQGLIGGSSLLPIAIAGGKGKQQLLLETMWKALSCPVHGNSV
jgi:hypothetical protein